MMLVDTEEYKALRAECDSLRRERNALREGQGELIATLDATKRERDTMLETLTIAQARCTELLNLTPARRWRIEVTTFADAMERKLRANEHKGHWANEDILYLMRRMNDEVVELKRAIGSGGAVLDEAADVANFAMMIADVCGALETKRQVP